MKKTILRLLVVLLTFVVTSRAAQAWTITRKSAPKFLTADQSFSDGTGNYTMYQITNDGGAQPGVWVTIDQLAGGVLALAANEDGKFYVGPMAAGATKTVGFYLWNDGNVATTTPQTHYINVYTSNPSVGSPSPALSQQFSITDVHDEQRAMANKPDIVVNTPNPPYLGGTVTVQLSGSTGTLGGTNDLLYSPAVLNTWRADAFKLYGSTIAFTGGNNQTRSNECYFILPNSADSAYVATFYFRINSTTASVTPANALAWIRSGVNLMKYSAVDPADIPAIQTPLNSLLLSKSVSTNALGASGGVVTYSLTLTNSAPHPVAVDDFIDTLPSSPAAVTYVASSAQFNGAAIADPSISGATLSWGGTFDVPASSARTLTFQATIPGTVGTYTNSAVTHIGSVQIDSTQSTSDNSPAQAMVTVSSTANLGVTKTAPSTVLATNNLTYAIVVTNAGPGAATSLVVTDSLPSSVTFLSATSGGTTNATLTNIFWNITSLASGATTNLGVTIRAPATGIISNSVVVGSPSPDPTPGDNTAGPILTTVTPVADLLALKSGATNVVAGASLAYTITITNAGPSAASSVSVNDTLPSGASFVSATSGGTNNAGVVGWPVVSSLAAGAATNFTVTVTAPGAGVLTNVTSATSTTTDPSAANNDGSAAASRVISTISALADVITTKSGATNVTAASSLVYTITVTNSGPSTASNVAVTDTLPGTVSFVSATGGGTNSAGVVGWPTISSLAAGVSTNFTVTVTAPASGTLTNTAASTSTTSDPTPANNNGTAANAKVVTTVSTVADLVTTKTGSATVNAASQTTYTISVTNGGPSSATSVAVADILPPGVTFVSASGGGTNSTGVVGWPSIPLLTTGAATNFTVTVTVPASGVLTNTATVGSPTPDPSLGSNTNQFLSTITAQADLRASKSAAANVDAGSNLAYTITVTNAGPSTASSVTVADTLPPGVTFVSASDGGTNAAGVVGWPNIPLLTAGATTNFTVTVTVPASGVLTNTAAVSSPTTDPTPGNNSGTAVSAIDAVADVVTTKSGPGSANAAENVSYTITVTNVGPSTASSVAVSDTLPVGVSFVSASGGGTNAAGVVGWPLISSLALGATTNFTVTVTAPAPGTLTNVAASVSPTTDPTPGNNNGSAANARVITPIALLADLRATKSAAANVDAGSNLAYTITVTNAGPSTASSVAVADTLPPGVTFVSASGGGTNAAGVVGWPNIPLLTAGATTNFTVTVTVPASGVLTNTAAVSSPTTDPIPGNNNGTAVSAIDAVADVVTTKSGPASSVTGSNIVYSITVTNAGPSAAGNVVLTDTLPAGVTFVGASAGGGESSGVVTWPGITGLAAGTSTNFTVTVTPGGAGIFTNVAASTSTTSDPDAANNDGSASNARVVTTVTLVVDVNGRLFEDAQPNSVADGGEDWTNGTNVFVNLIRGGAVVQSTTVAPGAGTYSFSNVTTGSYTLVVAATPIATTAQAPVGWLFTAPTDGTRTVNVGLTALGGQTFGLFHGSRVTGTVFADNGIGGGTANNGVRDGAEAGLVGVSVVATDNSGGTTYASASTAGGGNYTLWIPFSAGANPLRIHETNQPGYLSTGGSAGTTGGSYMPATDIVSFTNVIGTSYTGVNFADASPGAFAANGNQSALPGTTVNYAHLFVAGTAGSVSFSATNAPNPAIAGWTATVYRDVNCNGVLDSGEPLLTSAVALAAGEQACIIVKVFVPAAAPAGAQDSATVSADFVFANNPGLTASLTLTDLTTVGPGGTAGLTLLKQVDKATAAPGDVITYTITYTNNGTEDLGNIVIYDSTPAFTTFTAVSTGVLPASLTTVSMVAPAVGATGQVKWTFTGTLAPGSTGWVTFSVTVE